MTTTPPAVRWVPDGPHAGLYIWIPGIERWQRTDVRASGVLNIIVHDMPDGPEQPLVPIVDAGHAIDFYRNSLREEDRADSIPHAVARRAALRELADAADLAIHQPPDPPQQSDLTMADLRRAYDC
jgi:hypothetical protein